MLAHCRALRGHVNPDVLSEMRDASATSLALQKPRAAIALATLTAFMLEYTVFAMTARALATTSTIEDVATAAHTSFIFTRSAPVLLPSMKDVLVMNMSMSTPLKLRLMRFLTESRYGQAMMKNRVIS